MLLPCVWRMSGLLWPSCANCGPAAHAGCWHYCTSKTALQGPPFINLHQVHSSLPASLAAVLLLLLPVIRRSTAKSRLQEHLLSAIQSDLCGDELASVEHGNQNERQTAYHMLQSVTQEHVCGACKHVIKQSCRLFLLAIIACMR